MRAPELYGKAYIVFRSHPSYNVRKRKKTLEDILPRMSNKYIADPSLSDHHTAKNSLTPEIAIAIR